MRTVLPTLVVLAMTACEPGRSPDEEPGDGAPEQADASPEDSTPEPDAAFAEADEPEEALVEPTEAVEELPPEEPGPPLDYGVIKPSDAPPDPAELTVHALAGYEVVAIYDKPDIAARKLGYLRIGTRLMVTPKLDGEGCPRGFHQLAQGGYACASKGLVVDPDRPPYMHRPPTPARVERSLPYDYAFVHRWNSPMWWRPPTSQERTIAEEQRAILEAEREGLPLPGEEPLEGGTGGVATEALPSVTDPPAAPAEPAPVAEPAPTAEPEPEPEPIKLPLNPQTPWLERGFFISLGDKIVEDDQSWWHTARGAYVAVRDARQYGAKDFQGVALPEDATFPLGFVMAKDGTRQYELTEAGKLKPVGDLERRTFVQLAEEAQVGKHTYMITSDGLLLRKDHLRLVDPQPLPEGLEPWERWIDVSLGKQILVAYEGTRPVYVTLVSSGRKGPPDESFETPKGRFQIRSKHVSSTMDGNTASDGNYSIQDVPWAMFFEGSYAIHGAFWHESFGRVRSHGCVNLGPTDARWLFYWTTPFLPEGWHGVHAHDGSPGTTVIVRD